MKTILILLLASIGNCQENQVFYQGCFGGLDTLHDSSRIDDCNFQDVSNIITKNGYPEKRLGSLAVINPVNTGFPIDYQSEYVTNSNVKYVILKSSINVYSWDGSNLVRIATVTSTSILDSVTAFGVHFFTNGTDTPFYYDGTSSTTLSAMPKCKYIEFANERLFCANAPGYDSTLYSSAYGDYTDWTIPTNFLPTSANSWTFQRQDGKFITGLNASPFGVVAFKGNSIHILKGVDNDDFYKQRVNNEIGCKDDRSIQFVNGKLTWLADNGVYQWNGANKPDNISRLIDPSIKAMRQLSSNADSFEIDSQDDWQAGGISLNGARPSWDTETLPGNIIPSSWTAVDTSSSDWVAGTLTNTTTRYVQDSVVADQIMYNIDFEEPNYYVLGYPVAVDWGMGTASINVSSVCGSGSSGTFNFGGAYTGKYGACPAGTSPSAKINIYNSTMGLLYSATHTSAVLTQCTKYSIDLSTQTGGIIIQLVNNVTPAQNIYSSTISINSIPNKILDYGIAHRIANSDGTVCGGGGAASNVYVDFNVHFASSSFTSKVFDTGLSTPTGGPIAVSSNMPTGTQIDYFVRSATSAYGAWTSYSATSDTLKIPTTYQYWNYKADFYTSVSSATPRIDSVSLQAASTGTWDSAVLFVGTDITSWGQFNAVDTSSRAGTIAYYVRSATWSFADTNTGISWTAQTNGETISASTGSYAQIRALSQILSSSEPAKISVIQINWNEGESKSVASLVFDEEYYLSVNISTSVTYNDTVFVYQDNEKWTKFSGKSWATMGLFDSKPYAGDGTTGSKLYKINIDGLYSDDGSAIDSYFTTKDFQWVPNNDKTIRQFYLESYPAVSGVLSVGYLKDKSGSWNETTQSLPANTMFNDQLKKLIPGFSTGRYFRFKFSNNVVDEYLKLDGYSVIYDAKPLYRR